MIRRQRGFTLLELLVATAITVIIGVAATIVFGAAVDNRERVGARASQLADLQRAWLFIGRDFEQLAARPARDEFGDSQPFLRAAGDGTVELTRAGWMNPLQSRPRSTLQRIRYRVEDGKLFREYWDHPDRAVGATPESSALMHDVSDFKVQFLVRPSQGDLTWQDDWPTAADLQRPAALQNAPLAIAVEIEVAPFGRMRRFFRVPANPHARET